VEPRPEERRSRPSNSRADEARASPEWGEAWAVCEHVFVPTYSYSVAEHDPDRPWIVVGEIRRLTIELDEGANFYDWARMEWPPDRYEVTLDPWQLSPDRATQ
jgi:hypothetical protein